MRSVYQPEKDVDYFAAPETLLQSASCSLQTDIWMLGSLAYELLTGNAPFPSDPNKDVAAQMSTMRATLEDDLPEAWLSDERLRNFDSKAQESDASGGTSINAGLADALHKDDANSAAQFIKSCLRLDPSKRLTAKECMNHAWLSEANACSCGFC